MSKGAEFTKDSRPITMAILAMGGEGGGVLADWAVDMAEHCGYFAQTTSVPGVAQRTGTTVYYLEFFPQLEGETREPVLSTMAAPGEVDIVVASELMESGRAVQRGFISKEITTLITSTHRVYSMTEKTALGDGRVDSEVLMESSRNAAKLFISGDFAKVAETTKSLISAALYGALAGSGALPFEKSDFIASIERGGVGVANSINAFERSFEIATQCLVPPTKVKSVDISIGTKPRDVASQESNTLSPEEELAIINNPQTAVGFKLQELAARIKADFPEPAIVMLINGIKRCADYQDVAYASRYLDRLESVRDSEAKFGDGTSRTFFEVARYTALWMTYEDTIRVADLKIRRSRFSRVGNEAQVQSDQIMQIREFLHPRSEEFADTLPTAMGRWLLRSKPVTAFIEKLAKNGIILQTTSIRGYLALYFIARLKPIRPRSLRFNLEQQRMDLWVSIINREIANNYDLAYEIAECANLIKGYGDTHANGWRNFSLVMEQVDLLHNDSGVVARISELRKAALADDDGTKLRAILA